MLCSWSECQGWSWESYAKAHRAWRLYKQLRAATKFSRRNRLRSRNLRPLTHGLDVSKNSKICRMCSTPSFGRSHFASLQCFPESRIDLRTCWWNIPYIKWWYEQNMRWPAQCQETPALKYQQGHLSNDCLCLLSDGPQECHESLLYRTEWLELRKIVRGKSILW